MYMPDAPVLGATDPALYKSNQFSAWAKFASGTDAQNPVVTPDYATAPDGTMTASRIVLNRGTGTGNSGKYSILRAAGIPSANGINTDSVYLKLATGSTPVILDLRAFVTGVTETNKLVTITDQWQRFATQTPTIAGGTQDFDFILWDNPQLPGATSQVADVLAWNFRVDAGTAVQGPDYTARTRSPLKLLGLAIGAYMLLNPSSSRS